MNRTAAAFMKASVIYALAGLVLGVGMGMASDFSLKSVHSHINLLGWLGLAAAAFYYQTVPAATRHLSARLHFWTANLGLLTMTASLACLTRGVQAAMPGVALGSVVLLLSHLLFAYVVFASATESPRTA